jgi:hypothetical protein
MPAFICAPLSAAGPLSEVMTPILMVSPAQGGGSKAARTRRRTSANAGER